MYRHDLHVLDDSGFGDVMRGKDVTHIYSNLNPGMTIKKVKSYERNTNNLN
jgi:hypothetical protein